MDFSTQNVSHESFLQGSREYEDEDITFDLGEFGVDAAPCTRVYFTQYCDSVCHLILECFTLSNCVRTNST